MTLYKGTTLISGIVPDMANQSLSNLNSAGQDIIDGKANISLSNLDSTGQAVIDGGWVQSNATLANGVSWTGAAIQPYSLASYLPNDNYNYEVFVVAQAESTGANGKFCRIALTSDICGFAPLCAARSSSTTTQYGDGFSIIPVGTGRYLQQYSSTSANASGAITIQLRGYRRIGTNA